MPCQESCAIVSMRVGFTPGQAIVQAAWIGPLLNHLDKAEALKNPRFIVLVAPRGFRLVRKRNP